MEVNPYSNEDKEQRRRVIIVATTIAIIILGIAVWAIIAIVGGSKKNTEVAQNSDNQAKTSEVATKPTEAEAPKTEGVSTSNSNNSNTSASSNTASTSTTTNTSTTRPTTTSSEVPETGPEEILPFALVLGFLAAYLSSKKLSKKEFERI